MNNKEFTSELADRLGYTIKDTSELISSLLSDMTQELEDGNAIAIQGFGSFEVKKKAERISINPSTKQRMLVPPKLVLTYRPSNTLKDFSPRFHSNGQLLHKSFLLLFPLSLSDKGLKLCWHSFVRVNVHYVRPMLPQ